MASSIAKIISTESGFKRDYLYRQTVQNAIYINGKYIETIHINGVESWLSESNESVTMWMEQLGIATQAIKLYWAGTLKTTPKS